MTNKSRSPGRRSQAESQRTRVHVLDRAERLFARRGYRGASLRELARASGVRPFTIQHHFGSKLGLYRAVVDRWDDQVVEVVSRALGETADLASLIEKVVDELFDLLLAKRSWVAVTARAALGEAIPGRTVLGERDWVRFIAESLPSGELRLGKLDLGLFLITVEGILMNHVLSATHYKQLYGRDVTDPELKARTKAHLKRVILALLDAQT